MDQTRENSTPRAVYRIRSGTLEALVHRWNIESPEDLAVLLRITSEDLVALRHGALIGLPMAVHIADLMGIANNLSTWTELVHGE